jgi:hypothetical protein
MHKSVIRTPRLPSLSTESVDKLLYAVAFVMLRRQMRGKWTSPLRASTSALA